MQSMSHPTILGTDDTLASAREQVEALGNGAKAYLTFGTDCVTWVANDGTVGAVLGRQ